MTRTCRTTSRRRTLWVALLCAIAALSATSVAQAATERAVTFQVVNNNATGVIGCNSDNRAYTIQGHLVYGGEAPPSSVTLYLHGLGFGQFFWNFTAVGGYDYATSQADNGGHASVVIDRLGYDASSHPNGQNSCIGSQATIAHQVVQDLRSGHYTLSGGPAAVFHRVAIAGHSAGGLIAQVEAATFHDVDALAVVNFSDIPSPAALTTFAGTALTCVLGGQPAEGFGSPGGYAPFGATAAAFNAIMFHDAQPNVIAATDALRNRDPCGDISSVLTALVNDVLTLPSITVPVLSLLGANDVLFTPPTANLGRLEFLGSHDFTQTVVPDTGHASLLGNTAPVVRATLHNWLAARGF